jgi:hypothetical protein
MSEAFYGSAEIRWFLKGQHNQLGKILKWFCLQDQLPSLEEDKVKDGEYDPEIVGKPFVKQEQQRTDEYLLFPDMAATPLAIQLGLPVRSSRTQELLMESFFDFLSTFELHFRLLNVKNQKWPISCYCAPPSGPKGHGLSKLRVSVLYVAGPIFSQFWSALETFASMLALNSFNCA